MLAYCWELLLLAGTFSRATKNASRGMRGQYLFGSSDPQRRVEPPIGHDRAKQAEHGTRLQARPASAHLTMQAIREEEGLSREVDAGVVRLCTLQLYCSVHGCRGHRSELPTLSLAIQEVELRELGDVLSTLPHLVLQPVLHHEGEGVFWARRTAFDVHPARASRV